MAPNENEPLTFHNESALMLVARGAKLTGWVLFATYMVSSFGYLKQILDASAVGQLPTATMDLTVIFANLVQLVATGVFYLLIMHGLAQGLYVALDLFISTEDEEVEEGITL